MQDHESVAAIRLLVSSGQSSLRVLSLAREVVTIGRRPHNDIALDDLTVSGEHAMIRTRGTESVIHDLDSRNGTLVNGLSVSQRVLCDGDIIDIGIYRLRFVVERPAAPPVPAGSADTLVAWVDFLSGPDVGHSQCIDRPIVRIAGFTEQVAVIARRHGRFHLTHLDGLTLPQVNGEPIGPIAFALADGDLIEIAGVTLRFRIAR